MNVGIVGLHELRISVTLYTPITYLLSATQPPTKRFDRSQVLRPPALLHHRPISIIRLEITIVHIHTKIFAS
jgi:hypothetical protein